jgi:hypothetical protein
MSCIGGGYGNFVDRKAGTGAKESLNQSRMVLQGYASKMKRKLQEQLDGLWQMERQRLWTKWYKRCVFSSILPSVVRPITIWTIT